MKHSEETPATHEVAYDCMGAEGRTHPMVLFEGSRDECFKYLSALAKDAPKVANARIPYVKRKETN